MVKFNIEILNLLIHHIGLNLHYFLIKFLIICLILSKYLLHFALFAFNVFVDDAARQKL